MEEQPVALATIILSPNSCVTSFTYGVSPQPAQAPENSNKGCLNWLPFTVAGLSGLSTCSTVVLNLWLATSSTCSAGTMIRAFSLLGQTLAQLPQPVQSSGLTWMRNLAPLTPIAGFVANVAGTSVFSSINTGRIAACGQTSEHWLHWIHLSICHTGTLTAIPRFSYCVVPVGTTPASLNTLTGSWLPLWR